MGCGSPTLVLRVTRLASNMFHDEGLDKLQAKALVGQLEQYIDTFAGDALAELPDDVRTPDMPLTSLAAPLLAFATAVLKFKLSMPSTLKLLRRLLAAFLPDGNSEGECGL